MNTTTHTQTVTNTDHPALETRFGAGTYNQRGITLVRGEGAWLFDSAGKRYLDLTAGYGVAPLGHAHPALVETLREQAGKLWNCTGSFANPERTAFLEDLTASLPAGLDHVFLCNSGTEANEAAIKFARLATGRPRIVSAMRGFHGRTLGSLSATWDPKYREPFAPLVPDFHHAPYGKLEAFDELIDENTAGVILEVVQGEGGVRTGDPDFLRGVQELCRSRGAMFILDEVQTGFGRTGKLFALEHHGLEPDLLSLAKSIAGGFPMGATVLGERVGRIPAGAHGSTFGGNPLACALARRVLSVLSEEDLPGHAHAMGERLRTRLAELNHPKIREVRGLGLLCGIELKERVTPTLRMLQERGVICLPAGPNVLRFLPPLIIDEEQIDLAVSEVAAALDATSTEGGAA